LQWRVAEISAPGRAGFVAGLPWRYELEASWTSPETTNIPALLLIPAEICRSNHTYRARARYKDTTGRWGHWSAPVEFVAGR
jgi:hypothetical protein